jgi:hypothetical protein
MAIKRDPHKLFITIDNIAPADALALMKMFKYMEYLGNIGSSRMCSFYADGDGSFRPKVSFVYPIELPELPEISGIVTNKEIDDMKKMNRRMITTSEGDFVIDSDGIAWRIYYDK